ncbi:uncharacterized protein EI97DRAFT_243846 [Westerdykella ornata]|uniref:Uncharacterized protein n=1 Tax=Westerdykella ornata TaxID=318751 RepID=A0A6A6J9C1_WESOR|nr:uncharacterized protein EI97DRAFT_243846 [Westerdykella ornata]KAF2271819.1 hypothetical protein EI97DRAFT_243846 [Westerdykella ornata]
MDTTNALKRQTEILDPSAVEQALQRPVKKQKRARNVPTAAGSASTRALASSAPLAKVSASGPAAAAARTNTFTYNGVQVRVPLLQPNGRRRMPRGVLSLEAKLSRDKLLEVVEQYAGKREREVLVGVGLKKRDLAVWIAGVEAMALGGGAVGSGAVGDGGKSTPEGVHCQTDTRPTSTNGSSSTPARQKMASGDGRGTGKSLSSSQNHIANPNHEEGTDISSHTMAPPTKPTAAKRPENFISKKQPPKKKNQKHASATAAQPPSPYNPGKHAVHEPRERDEESDDDELDALLALQIHKQIEEEDCEAELQRQQRINWALANGFTMETVKRHSEADDWGLGNPHPLVPLLDLDPNDVDKYAYAIDLPETREVALIHALSDRAVVQMVIPYSDLVSKPDYGKPAPVTRRQRPYLKPGRHGYEYGKSKWSWEGDPDLVTVVGHQIEPGDSMRLGKGEFESKYYGYRTGHLWPCGCQKVPAEGEYWSEEE